MLPGESEFRGGVIWSSFDATEASLGTIARFCHIDMNNSEWKFERKQRAMLKQFDGVIEDTTEEEIASFNRIAVSCYKRRHMSIFEFAHGTFEIACPIYVARQIMRHRNGVFMEKSLRCLEPYKFTDNPTGFIDIWYDEALKGYVHLTKEGYKKEEARMILPLSTPTSFLWKLSLRSLFNVFDQRLHPSAQRTTRELVFEMYQATKKQFPLIMQEWEQEHPNHKTEETRR